ncbi:MAG TPA: hypothetical protein VII36_12890, partial [Usitatibacter sp.]
SSFRANCRVEDSARLHFGDLRIGDPEPAPAMAKHGIRLAQIIDDSRELFAREAERSREQLCLLTAMRQKLVERWIEQANVDGQPVHRLEDPLEVGALHRLQLGQRSTAPRDIARDNHLAHGVDPVTLEEHVLGTAEADAFGPEPAGDPSVLRRVGVGADAKATNLVGPSEQSSVRRVGWRVFRAARAPNDRNDFAWDGGQIAEVHAASRPVDGDPIPLVNGQVSDAETAVVEAHLELLASDDRALTHTACDNRGVAGHAAARREDRARRNDAVEVLGGSFFAHEDHSLAVVRAFHGDIRIEDGDAACRAGARRESGRDGGGAQRSVEDGV